MKCLICGKEGSYLCDECKSKVDLQTFCFDVFHNTNGIRDNVECNLLEVIENIVSNIKSPEKELMLIKTFSYKPKYRLTCGYSVRDLLDNNYEKIIDNNNISESDKQIIKCIKLSRSFFNKEYDLSYEIANELYEQDLSNECLLTLVDYYTLIRQYDKAIELTSRVNDDCVNFYLDDCKSRQSGKKRAYLPATKEDKEKYIYFINSIGITIEKHVKKRGSEAMKEEDYPEVEFLDDMNFDSFVAYDLETTGLSSKRACITEIGAIKVINGKIIDSKKYKFQELVHPYARITHVEKDAEKVTGITTEMIKNARSIKEVFNDFADFIEDYPLVGYNNKTFDSVRLRRAGRYAHRVITNKQFDLLPVAKRILRGGYAKLSDIAKEYNIVNPNAHRAYADALTTAKVFMMIKNDKLN